MPVTVRTITDRADLDRYYVSGSTLCWECLVEGEEQMVCDELAKGLEVPELRDQEIGVVTGAVMNATYGLTGSNAYPDDLRLALIPVPDDVRSTQFVELAVRGLRFFDNIITNNAAKQREEDAPRG